MILVYKKREKTHTLVSSVLLRRQIIWDIISHIQLKNEYIICISYIIASLYWWVIDILRLCNIHRISSS